MDSFSDDYLATLGGSLMKDLLADLQVVDGDWSLDQLERELAQLDHEPQPQTHSLPHLSAASLVVSHAGRSTVVQPPPQLTSLPIGMDAWSLSLEKFSGLSLEQDFLAADAVRKQQQIQAPPQAPAQPSFSLEGMEDYDVGEMPTLPPPPGMGGAIHGVLQSQLIKPDDIMNQPMEVQAQLPLHPKPPAQRFPKTPQNSLVLPDGDARDLQFSMSALAPLMVAMPPQDTAAAALSALGIGPSIDAIKPQGEGHSTSGELPPPQLGIDAIPSQQQHPSEGLPPLVGAIPMQENACMVTQSHQLQTGIVPSPGSMPIHTQGIMADHMAGMPQMHPGHPQMMQPVPFAIPAAGAPWHVPPMPPPMRVYCNPHPSAPPIPAAALESSLMKSRDIAYVIHSILKPILSEGVSESDYDIQFLRRLSGRQVNHANPKHLKDVQGEITSRATKSKEWSSEKGVLGLVAKTNVARPRALIATPVSTGEQDTEQKQRASLWKARIYCDQAYQSYQSVVEIWRSAPPGAVPPQVQLHLMKLMKCFGITLSDKEYKVDQDALKLLMKLSKGRSLLARVLEQALLPPHAVQALLPSVLEVLLSSSTRKNGEDIADDRLFRAIAMVVPRVNLASAALLESTKTVLANGKAALASTARMECLHALLQKGAIVFAQEPSVDLKAEWGNAEKDFMVFLQSM
jgi:hypothetical protein